MKIITYNSIEIQNFMSIGHDSVKVDFKKGLNFITGENKDNPTRKNAVGKTTIMNAFFFALFGETLSPIKQQFLINYVTNSKGFVEITFDVETERGKKSYILTRDLKPSKLTLKENGQDISRDSIANTTAYISKLVSLTPQMFKSCEMMTNTSNQNTSFMSLKADAKRKLIDDIFNLNIFGLMLKDLKKLITENNKNLSVQEALVSETQTTLANYKEQYDKLLKERENYEERINKQIKDYENKKEEKFKSLEKLKNAQEKLQNHSIEDQIKNLRTHIQQLDTDSNENLENIRKITSDIAILTKELKELNEINDIGGGKCPKCRQNVEKDHILHISEDIISKQVSIAELEDEKLRLNGLYEGLKKNKQRINDKIEEFKMLKDKLNEIEGRIKEVEERIDEYEDIIDSLNEDLEKSIVLEDFSKNIESTEKIFEERNEKYKDIVVRKEDYELVKFILGDEGVKSSLIKNLVGVLNATIQKYLDSLGINLKCSFDEYFDETIKNKKNKNLSYNNLSGAERRSVDLACVFSFSDLRRKINGVKSNINFYDEIFDGGFDETGLDKLIQTLKERIEKNNLCVYAISHRKEMLKHIDGEIIFLERERDITRRVKNRI